MIALLALVGSIGCCPSDLQPGAPLDTGTVAVQAGVAGGTSIVPLVAPPPARADTTRRPRPIQVGEWYARRLQIHRYTAYAVPPLFVYQYVVGQRLYDGVSSAEGEADWVRPAHRTGAALIAAAFAVNTVTGLWNLWEGRGAREGRALRVVHGVTMLAALGGFAYAGVELSGEARQSAAKRDQHRNVALGSMGLTLGSGLLMWFGNR